MEKHFSLCEDVKGAFVKAWIDTYSAAITRRYSVVLNIERAMIELFTVVAFTAQAYGYPCRDHSIFPEGPVASAPNGWIGIVDVQGDFFSQESSAISSSSKLQTSIREVEFNVIDTFHSGPDTPAMAMGSHHAVQVPFHVDPSNRTTGPNMFPFPPGRQLTYLYYNGKQKTWSLALFCVQPITISAHQRDFVNSLGAVETIESLRSRVSRYHSDGLTYENRSLLWDAVHFLVGVEIPPCELPKEDFITGTRAPGLPGCIPPLIHQSVTKLLRYGLLPHEARDLFFSKLPPFMSEIACATGQKHCKEWKVVLDRNQRG